MEKLGIDPKLLIAQLINFGVFFLIFRFFIAKPFMQFIRKEKESEEKLANATSEADRIMKEVDGELSVQRTKTRKETEVLIAQAKKDATAYREKLISQAQADAEDIRKKMNQDREDEKARRAREEKDTVGRLSVLMIEKSLQNYLDEETKKRLTTHILSKVNT